MCGICGIKGHFEIDILRRMNDAMIHRGPDSSGYYSDTECGLGMRRLKIIDLHSSEQPIYNEDRSLVLICNGEIYNYKSLRSFLKERGHSFKTDGDVEVIIHLYEEYQEDCVHKLDGMFAFAIWDINRKRLLLVRDRLGVKPLYYFKKPNSFAFASEIKGLMASGMHSMELDEESIVRYVAYPAVPAPLTVFRDIKAVLPGHRLLIDNAGMKDEEYWDVDFVKSSYNLMDEKTAIEAVSESLSQSIQKRLMSDVPLGAFLSGGIDSSSVVALMGTMSDQPVKTVSIRFSGYGKEFDWFDDASFATTVAESFHTDHTEEVVTGQDVYNNLADAIWAMDQPSGDAIQYYLVSKSAKNDVTVALSGTGGDEVFAGYEWFKEIKSIDQFHKRFGSIIKLIGNPLLSVINCLPRKYHLPRILHQMETILSGRNSFIDRYRLNRRMYRGNDWFHIFSKEFLLKLSDISLDKEPRFDLYAQRCDSLDSVAKTSYLQIKTDMANLLLRDQDAVSMAHSLEVRLPMIDYKVVETAAQIPSNLKLHNKTEKYILRKALEPLLPSSITSRTKKGFIFPMGSWMRNELKDVVDSCLSIEATKKRNIFNPQTIDTMRRDFFSGKQPFFKIWNQVVFELWCRIMLDRKEGWVRPSQDIRDFI